MIIDVVVSVSGSHIIINVAVAVGGLCIIINVAVGGLRIIIAVADGGDGSGVVVGGDDGSGVIITLTNVSIVGVDSVTGSGAIVGVVITA
jgi:hypothetical protein